MKSRPATKTRPPAHELADQLAGKLPAEGGDNPHDAYVRACAVAETAIDALRGEADEACLLRRLLQWALCSGEVGSSALTLVVRLVLGSPPDFPWDDQYPFDDADLDRCRGVVAVAPELRRRLPDLPALVVPRRRAGWERAVNRLMAEVDR